MSDPLSRWPFTAPPVETGPLERKTAGWSAASDQPAALVPPCGVSDCARHLGGCLLARAPDSCSMKAGACMKP